MSIHKQDWRQWADYKFEIGAYNVIYMLLDDVNKLIYVGEARDMVKRFNAHNASQTTWTHYKYNVLPDSLEPYRVSIERMLIRDLACLLKNEQNIKTINISEYKLINRKIDQ
ncbi:GIY-YIG nuclease family protein [Thalassotalea maritima]|uniref:GIY-YIG nuclease family protein n=1 Tax=Thalassotalea maritima TaxID=3242416 RepID=UPI0035279983